MNDRVPSAYYGHIDFLFSYSHNILREILFYFRVLTSISIPEFPFLYLTSGFLYLIFGFPYLTFGFPYPIFGFPYPTS